MSESEEQQGSLADAIAAHLELKKEHGADPDAIEQEKAAALGRVRRDADDNGPAQQPAPMPPAGDAPASGAQDEQAPEPVRDAPVDEAVVDQPVAEPEPETEPAPTGETFEFDWSPQREQEQESESPAETAAPPVPGPSDDVLEETPEFFEETPEYDKLWFEERSPKNFDF